VLFNSIDFAVFLPLVFAIYWLIPSKRYKLQNGVIFVASYVFYGWWDWRFLTLIFFSTTVDFYLSKYLSTTENETRRKFLLACSVIVNLGLLAVFKYLNFFLESFVTAYQLFGTGFEYDRIHIILPVGISFYTFQTLSYTIDVYRRKIQPSHDFLAFGAFVSFFPQLVAGPIERASNMLPQFNSLRKFDFIAAKDGLRQILWGLFIKMLIADQAAVYVNLIYGDHESYSGSTLLIGSILFAFQIYCDFAGYSHIAIGVGKLFGIQLMSNFAFPYFSRDIAEFWRRWHISLSTWFRDYVYIPLGGSRVGKAMAIRNITIVFVVSGFWHGANWTFIIWGFLHALFYLPLFLSGKNRENLAPITSGGYVPVFSDLLKILSTFLLTTLAWVFFRSESVSQAVDILINIFSSTFFSIPEIRPIFFFLLLIVFILVEWIGRHDQYAVEKTMNLMPRYLRWALYYSMIAFLLNSGTVEQDFIYFQF
jgi:D-alanyl-lipoteichoic acid acyltransferase DltB (MBOAT superfamily)